MSCSLGLSFTQPWAVSDGANTVVVSDSRSHVHSICKGIVRKLSFTLSNQKVFMLHNVHLQLTTMQGVFLFQFVQHRKINNEKLPVIGWLNQQ